VLVLVLVLARLVLVGRLVWLLLVLARLRRVRIRIFARRMYRL
jgi:hypothetical protein